MNPEDLRIKPIEFYTLIGFDAWGDWTCNMGGTAHRRICSYQHLGVARVQREGYMKWLPKGMRVRILHTMFDLATGDSTVEWVD